MTWKVGRKKRIMEGRNSYIYEDSIHCEIYFLRINFGDIIFLDIASCFYHREFP
jgi:hypothetical protein